MLPTQNPCLLIHITKHIAATAITIGGVLSSSRSSLIREAHAVMSGKCIRTGRKVWFTPAG